MGTILGHTMFRVPKVLRSVAPGCHVDVYQQNLRPWRALSGKFTPPWHARFPSNSMTLPLRLMVRNYPLNLSSVVFDKGTDVPNFVCVNGWRAIQRNIFLLSPRYRELLRCTTARDARFLLLWRLADTLSPTSFGKYCAFSLQHPVSLLPDLAATQSACMHGCCRPSTGFRRRPALS